MTVLFRNVQVAPDAPVPSWPYEALVALIERGTLGDWTLLTREIDADPWGDVARQVEDYLAYQRPWGVGPLLERAIARARRERDRIERDEVAAEVDALIRASRLTTQDFARQIGTSRSRLSTYRSGRVTPSAALLVRMRRVADRHRAAAGVGNEPDRTAPRG